MSLEIFTKADEQANKALSLMKKGEDLFPNTYVPTDLLVKGLTFYKGVVVPLEAVSYKYLVDYYQKCFLQAYITLFTRLWEEKSSLTNEFAFRVILEMGIENSFLVYGRGIEDEDRKLYFTVLLLADYGSIDTGMKSMYYNWFNRLFIENEKLLKERLTEKDLLSLVNLRAQLANCVDRTKYRKAVEYVRILVNKTKSQLLDKYAQKGVYVANENIKGMKSGEAHTLHGNIFLLIERLSKKSEINHLFRLYSYLLLPTAFLLRRLSEYHENRGYTAEVTQFLDDYNIFGREISSAWASSM